MHAKTESFPERSVQCYYSYDDSLGYGHRQDGFLHFLLTFLLVSFDRDIPVRGNMIPYSI